MVKGMACLFLYKTLPLGDCFLAAKNGKKFFLVVFDMLV